MAVQVRFWCHAPGHTRSRPVYEHWHGDARYLLRKLDGRWRLHVVRGHFVNGTPVGPWDGQAEAKRESEAFIQSSPPTPSQRGPEPSRELIPRQAKAAGLSNPTTNKDTP